MNKFSFPGDIFPFKFKFPTPRYEGYARFLEAMHSGSFYCAVILYETSDNGPRIVSPFSTHLFRFSFSENGAVPKQFLKVKICFLSP